MMCGHYPHLHAHQQDKGAKQAWSGPHPLE